MKVAVLRERAEGETRVALTADVAQRLAKAGHEVTVESGAGVRASVPDAAYEKAGARIAADAASALAGAHVVLLVQPPPPDLVPQVFDVFDWTAPAPKLSLAEPTFRDAVANGQEDHATAGLSRAMTPLPG